MEPLTPMRSIFIFIAVFAWSNEVLADERDFEKRMYGYSLKRASDIDVIPVSKTPEIIQKRLFREEYRKHVLAILAKCVNSDSKLRKSTNSDIIIHYVVSSDGSGYFECTSAQKANRQILKLILQLDDVLRKQSFCIIPKSQGDQFGGHVSLSDLLKQPSEEQKILSKDFFVRAMR